MEKLYKGNMRNYFNRILIKEAWYSPNQFTVSIFPNWTAFQGRNNRKWLNSGHQQ